MIKTRLNEIQSPRNPDEFNYSGYMANRQIFHTTYLDTNQCINLHSKILINKVWNFGLQAKNNVINSLRKSELSDDAKSICEALITGFDDDIDQNVMDAFSHSGTLHVLSVSGLHTGVIYLFINFLFNFSIFK